MNDFVTISYWAMWFAFAMIWVSVLTLITLVLLRKADHRRNQKPEKLIDWGEPVTGSTPKEEQKTTITVTVSKHLHKGDLSV